jgi:hypothetical protein
VQLHGGTTDIRSKLGVGTCVTVRLPMNCEHTRQAPQLAKPAAQPIAIETKKRDVPRSAAEQQVRKSA